jgi:hypothetical protein
MTQTLYAHMNKLKIRKKYVLQLIFLYNHALVLYQSYMYERKYVAFLFVSLAYFIYHSFFATFQMISLLLSHLFKNLDSTHESKMQFFFLILAYFMIMFISIHFA